MVSQGSSICRNYTYQCTWFSQRLSSTRCCTTRILIHHSQDNPCRYVPRRCGKRSHSLHKLKELRHFHHAIVSVDVFQLTYGYTWFCRGQSRNHCGTTGIWKRHSLGSPRPFVTLRSRIYTHFLNNINAHRRTMRLLCLFLHVQK